MPMYHGTTSVGSIYYGSTSIGRVYHGTTLVFSKSTYTPPADIVVAVQPYVSGTSTGSQNFTSTPLTGLTPAVALVLATYHAVADATETTTAGFSFGPLSGTSQITVNPVARAFGSAAASRSGTQANAHYLIDTSYSGVAQRGTGSLISGGISINLDANDGTSRNGSYLAFAGANVSAATGVVNLGTGTSAIDVNTVGFQPDVVMFYGGFENIPAGHELGAALTIGFATPTDQYCVLQNCTDGGSTSDPVMALLTNKCGADLSRTGGQTYTVTAGDFDSSGFSVTPSASAGSDRLAYLALKFTGGNVKLMPFTTPTTTGVHSITGVGFPPGAAIVILTNLEATDPSFPISTGSTMTGLSINYITDSAQSATSTRIQSGTGAFGTKVKATALLGANGGDIDAIEASFVSFDTDGMTLNYSATQGTAKKGFILFIESEIAAPEVSGTPSIASANGFFGVGDELTATPATTVNGSTSYQWKRNGAAISGATGLAYTLTGDDLGATVTFTHTASNGAGADSATSAGVGPVVTPTFQTDTRIAGTDTRIAGADTRVTQTRTA